MLPPDKSGGLCIAFRANLGVKVLPICDKSGRAWRPGDGPVLLSLSPELVELCKGNNVLISHCTGWMTVLIVFVAEYAKYAELHSIPSPPVTLTLAPLPNISQWSLTGKSLL